MLNPKNRMIKKNTRKIKTSKEMSFFALNLRYLRKKKDLTQEQLADLIHKKRSSIAAYEEGVATPPMPIIAEICYIFDITLDEIITKDLEKK